MWQASDMSTAEARSCIDRSLALFRAGNPQAALELAERGLAADPDNATLLGQVGVFAARLGDAARAEAAYRRAIALHPADPGVHYNLANLLRGQRRADESEAEYREAIRCQPDYAEAWCNLGNLYRDLRRVDAAQDALREAMRLKPGFADAYCNIGNLHFDRGQFNQAEAAYRAAIERRPAYPEAWSNLGVLLKARGRLDEAEGAHRQAIAARPDYAPAWSNLGVLLIESQRLAEAIEACSHATELQPAYGDAWVNLGNALQHAAHLGAAEAAYRRAIATLPDVAEARWNLSLLLLRQGRFAAGWVEHESRYSPARRRRKATPPELPPGAASPAQWRGEALHGKSLLVWPEQGLGDEIQFARYLPLLRGRGVARLVLGCKPPLKPLFQAQGAALADDIVAVTEWQPAMAACFDYWCYPLSLPLHFGTTLESIPARSPYLLADPVRVAYWRTRLPQAAPRVGLVWKGSPVHANDANRSLPSLAVLDSVLAIPGIAFISLQKGAGEDEARAAEAAGRLRHLGDEIADFGDSAAILDCLDLVVTVDTAIAHLAGAMGKPCRVLLPDFGTDWRWMDGREDTPWYPETMRLHRRVRGAGWDEPVQRIAQELGCLAAAA
jgi:tetratricopeptide (TPR) repeat protein